MDEVVYFISSPDKIKVGYSTQFELRLTQLRRDSFDDLEVLGTIEAGRNIEAAIHARLLPHKIKGEWYKKNEDVQSLIRAILDDGPYAALGLEKPVVLAKDADTAAAVSLRLVKMAAIVITEDFVTYINKYRDPRAFKLGADIATASGRAMEMAKRAKTDAELNAVCRELEEHVERAQRGFAELRMAPTKQVYFPEHYEDEDEE
jgi:hypothetical protein